MLEHFFYEYATGQHSALHELIAQFQHGFTGDEFRPQSNYTEVSVGRHSFQWTDAYPKPFPLSPFDNKIDPWQDELSMHYKFDFLDNRYPPDLDRDLRKVDFIQYKLHYPSAHSSAWPELDRMSPSQLENEAERVLSLWPLK